MISKILHFDLISESTCVDLIEHSNLTGKWKKAPVNKMAGENNPYLRQAEMISGMEEQLINDFTVLKILSPLFHTGFFESIPKNFSITNSALIKYNKGDFLRMHSDKATGMENRIISFLTYLNEGFYGGETYFPMQDKMVVPKTGRTVIFPSELLHESRKLIDGIKYAHIFFITVGEGEDLNYINSNQLITNIKAK